MDRLAPAVREASFFEESEGILPESEGELHKQDWNSSPVMDSWNNAHWLHPIVFPLEGREGKAAQQEAVNA